MDPINLDEILEDVAGPLLDRCRQGMPALGIAFYTGPELDKRWSDALLAWGQARGLFVEHLVLKFMGDTAVRQLLQRNRITEHLFSLEIKPDDIPDAALGRSSSVSDLNIHRDTFRDRKLCLLLWVPLSHARRFFELAANLADYRTVDLDLPELSDDAVYGSFVHVPENSHEVAARHNLPVQSLGGGFVGRETEIARVRALLIEKGQGAITDALAIEGLGGVGKTRLALEYAWTHLHDYDWIFFLRGDSPATLFAGLASLSDDAWLSLPAAQESSEEARMKATLAWFAENDRWLLILDNADSEVSSEVIRRQVLPRAGRGHLLLTSRFRRWGGKVAALPIEVWPLTDAVNYLITATVGKRVTTSDDPCYASRIAQAVGGLPLALEQIAAWIRTHNDTLPNTLEAIATPSAEVLHWFDENELKYPLPVAAVWERTVGSLAPTERFLVRFMAWMAPEPVPDFCIKAVKSIWIDPDNSVVDFIAIGRRLADRSVIAYRSDRSFQIHRLWRELERRRTPSIEVTEWNSNVAAVLARVVDSDPQDVRVWPKFALLKPHAIQFFEASRIIADKKVPDRGQICEANLAFLLGQFGTYAFLQAQFGEAEALMRRALAIDEVALGPEDPKLATDLINLAELLQETDRLGEAEPLMLRALKIDEARLGPVHREVAIDLTNIAILMQCAGRHAEAEPLARRALAIVEEASGIDHPDIVPVLNSLATLLQATKRSMEAEPLMWRGLVIVEQNYGSVHPNVAAELNNIAKLLIGTNRKTEAEPLMRRALSIDEKLYGSQHPKVAIHMNNLAHLLQDASRFAEAELLRRRALEVDEQRFGQEHPVVGRDLNNLAMLLREMKRVDEAGPFMRRALVNALTATRRSGKDRARLAAIVRNYIVILKEQKHDRQFIHSELEELGAKYGIDLETRGLVQ